MPDPQEQFPSPSEDASVPESERQERPELEPTEERLDWLDNQARTAADRHLTDIAWIILLVILSGLLVGLIVVLV